MPEFVCRIRRRKGQPLGLSLSPRIGFLDLPLELRNQIYRHSLVASEPITVWSGSIGESEEDPGNHPAFLILTSWTKVEAAIPNLYELDWALFRCNRQVSREAAATLYQFNTFRLQNSSPDVPGASHGHSCWNALYVFLQMIGEDNRSHLQSLDLHLPKPTQVWQHADGTRTSLTSWQFRQVIPQSEYLQRYSAPVAEGMVDHVDPAMEACFRILGKTGSALSLVLRLDPHLLPGAQMMFDEQHPDSHHFGLDLPILIEHLRRDFTADSGTASRVDVLWKGECLRDRFTDQMGRIQDQGWVIVDQAEGSVGHDRHAVLTMRFTLRRKEASRASPSSDVKAS